MAYPFGERIEGIMKIAEVTTDTETGCLAFSAVMITGSVTDNYGEGTTRLNVEPMELCYISRTGGRQTLWKFDFDRQGAFAAEAKSKTIDRFVKRNNADITSIGNRLELFRTNQFYEMANEDVGAFAAARGRNVWADGRLASCRKDDSVGMLRVFRSLKRMNRLGAVVTGEGFKPMKRRAEWN